jgi:hypothetical protein
MGVPIATSPAAYQAKWGSLGRPVTEQPGVSRSNYYSKDTDLDDYTVNMFTARYRKEVNDWLTVTNDTRIAGYTRYFAQTVTNCNPTNNAENGGSSCAANLFDDDPATVPVYGFGGPAGFDQDIWGMENITTAIAPLPDRCVAPRADRRPRSVLSARRAHPARQLSRQWHARHNLTDELNYSGGFGNRAVVGPGRAFTLTVGATF